MYNCVVKILRSVTMLHKSDSDDSNDSWREVSPTAFEQFRIIHQGYLTKHKVINSAEASSTYIKVVQLY